MIIKDSRSPRGRIEPDVQRTFASDVPSDSFQPRPEGHGIGKDRLRWLFRSMPWQSARPARVPITLICEVCSSTYTRLTVRAGQAQTCSDGCRAKQYRRRKAA